MFPGSRSLLRALPPLLLLAACETASPVSPSGQQGISAQLRTDGDAVFVNGGPASYGQAIRQGDVVTTGPGSSALIRFSDGTRVQLDENTDPIFSWSQQQLQIEMAAGLIEVVKGTVVQVVEVITDTAEFFAESRFAVEVERARSTRADLFSGRITMIRPEAGATVMPGQYLVATVGGGFRTGPIPPSRARELRRRLDRWEFARGPGVEEGVAAGVAVGVLGILLGTMLGDDDDDDYDGSYEEEEPPPYQVD